MNNGDTIRDSAPAPIATSIVLREASAVAPVQLAVNKVAMCYQRICDTGVSIAWLHA